MLELIHTRRCWYAATRPPVVEHAVRYPAGTVVVLALCTRCGLADIEVSHPHRKTDIPR